MGVDVQDAEVRADLASADGRSAAVDEIGRVAGDALDGLVVAAGIGGSTGAPSSLVARVNYFGAVTLLDGLRPMLEQGDRPAARTLCEQALAIFRGLNDRWGIASSLADLGHLSRDEGNRQSTQAWYRESIEIFRELGYRRGIARLLEDFACAAVTDGKPERALRLAGAAAALREALGARLPPDEQPKLERVLAQARAAVAPAAAQQVWTEGATMPLERAIDYGLNWTAI